MMGREELYRTAYSLHYEEQEYAAALAGYRMVMEQYPESAEAGYSQSQVDNLGNIAGFDPTASDADLATEVERVEQAHRDRAARAARDVPLTTAPFLEGFRVVETLEIVTAECAFGINIFRDLFAGMRDFFGGRSRATQKDLRDARRECLAELKTEARSVGADAVIGVKLDYSEISGHGKSMLFLVASGTAVRLAAVPNPDADHSGVLAAHGS